MGFIGQNVAIFFHSDIIGVIAIYSVRVICSYNVALVANKAFRNTMVLLNFYIIGLLVTFPSTESVEASIQNGVELHAHDSYSRLSRSLCSGEGYKS